MFTYYFHFRTEIGLDMFCMLSVKEIHWSMNLMYNYPHESYLPTFNETHQWEHIR